MIKRRLLFPVLVVIWAFVSGSSAQSPDPGSRTDPVLFAQADATPDLRAVFIHFLAYLRNEDDPGRAVDGAISISNVCAVPDQLALYMGDRSGRGRVKLYLYDLDGERITYMTQADSPGEGLDPDGYLGPGQTWTVRLAEILADAAGVPEREVGSFRGYGWVVSSFDCLAGTYTNTIFGLGFSQAYEMSPAMGQGGFFGGVEVP